MWLMFVLFVFVSYSILYWQDYQKSKIYFKQQLTGITQWILLIVFLGFVLLFTYAIVQ